MPSAPNSFDLQISRKIIRQFWVLLLGDGAAAAEERLPHHIYVSEWHPRLASAIIGWTSPEKLLLLATEDWRRDAHGRDSMSFDDFVASLVETYQIWKKSGQSLIGFLLELQRRLCITVRHRVTAFRPLEDQSARSRTPAPRSPLPRRTKSRQQKPVETPRPGTSFSLPTRLRTISRHSRCSARGEDEWRWSTASGVVRTHRLVIAVRPRRDKQARAMSARHPRVLAEKRELDLILEDVKMKQRLLELLALENPIWHIGMIQHDQSDNQSLLCIDRGRDRIDTGRADAVRCDIYRNVHKREFYEDIVEPEYEERTPEWRPSIEEGVQTLDPPLPEFVGSPMARVLANMHDNLGPYAPIVRYPAV